MTTQCQYENLAGEKICSEEVWQTSKDAYCLMHALEKDKPQNLFENKIFEKIKKKDYQFQGYVFPYAISFKEIIFEEFANFEKCQFLGTETSFYKCHFKKGVLFNEALFEGLRLNFSRSIFQGDFTLFNHCQFLSDLIHWSEAQFFSKHLSFALSVFKNKKLYFEKSIFKSSTYFNEIHMSANEVHFSEISILGDHLSFYKSEFQCKELIWTKSRFHLSSQGTIDFKKAHFECNKNDWSHLQFKANQIDFSHSYFNGNHLSFEFTEWDFDLLLFNHCHFETSETLFSHAQFRGKQFKCEESIFQNKRLLFYPIEVKLDSLSFAQSEWAGGEKLIKILGEASDISFEACIFQGGRTRLSGQLTEAVFANSFMDQVDLTEAKWQKKYGRPICKDELIAYQLNTEEAYESAVEVCRNIKKSYEQFGSYESAGDFYYGEMECKRKVAPFKRKLALTIISLISGYGERPIRVILTSLFLILSTSFFYLLGGLKTPDGIIQRPWGFNFFTPFHTFLSDFLHCVYFSVVSFTTLGYGDYQPHGYSRLVGACEGFIGAFFIALFVLTISRKMNR